MKSIIFNGFSYHWDKNSSFLSHSQASYALESLWKLVADDAKWEDSSKISFSAINYQQMTSMITLPANKLYWVSLKQVTPKQSIHGLDTDKLPALCSIHKKSKIVYDGSGFFPLDLVAATFILLTRWEEWKYPKLDKFSRHKEDATLSAKQGFRDRPVIDEWAKILRLWLYKKEPCWNYRAPESSIWISHDIDHMCYYKSPLRLIRALTRDILQKKPFIEVFRNITSGIRALSNSRKDPCFEAILDLMQRDEKIGQKATFFFMFSQSSKFDEGYDLSSENGKFILSLLEENQHEIAWHPSFFSAKSLGIFSEELNNILRVTQKRRIGLRHHYLRWNAGISWNLMADKGIKFDSTLGYSQSLGFRASTAHDYTAYDLINDKPLNLKVRPFIVMDTALNITNQKQLSILIERTMRSGGNFSIIIHNYTVMANPKLVNFIYETLKNSETTIQSG